MGGHLPQRSSFLAQAALVAGKDLEIEWRSRVTASRVLPFAGILLLLFAVALDPDRGLLPRVAPGLFWVAAMLAALLAIGRAFTIERENRAGLGLLLSGIDPAAMYVGKPLPFSFSCSCSRCCSGSGWSPCTTWTPATSAC